MIEKSRADLNQLLKCISEEKTNLSCEGENRNSQASWSWSVAETKSWSSQSWSK